MSEDILHETFNRFMAKVSGPPEPQASTASEKTVSESTSYNSGEEDDDDEDDHFFDAVEHPPNQDNPQSITRLAASSDEQPSQQQQQQPRIFKRTSSGIEILSPSGEPIIHDTSKLVIRDKTSGRVFSFGEISTMIDKELGRGPRLPSRRYSVGSHSAMSLLTPLSSSSSSSLTDNKPVTITGRPRGNSDSSIVVEPKTVVITKNSLSVLSGPAAAMASAVASTSTAGIKPRPPPPLMNNNNCPPTVLMASGGAPIKADFKPAWVKCQTLQQTSGAVWSMKWSPNGQFLCTGGHDKEVKIWRRIALSCPMFQSSCSGTGNNPSGSGLSTSVRACVVEKTPILTLVGHEDDVLDMEWSARSNKLAICSMDHGVRVWSLQDAGDREVRGSLIAQLWLPDVVTGISFNPQDEDLLLTSSLDCHVRIWSLSQSKVLFCSSPHDNWVTSCIYALDGKVILYGLFDGSFALLDPCNGYAQMFRAVIDDMRKRKDGHIRITGMSVSPTNPALVLITAADCRLRLYELNPAKGAARLIAKFKGHRIEDVYLIRATFSSDGAFIVCPSEDRNVYIWRVPPLPPPLALATGTVVHPRTAKHSLKGDKFVASGLVGTAAVFVPPLLQVAQPPPPLPPPAMTSSGPAPVPPPGTVVIASASVGATRSTAPASSSAITDSRMLMKSASASSLYHIVQTASSSHVGGSCQDLTVVVADKLGEISIWRNCIQFY